jgi:hypothetical protein
MAGLVSVDRLARRALGIMITATVTTPRDELFLSSPPC